MPQVRRDVVARAARSRKKQRETRKQGPLNRKRITPCHSRNRSRNPTSPARRPSIRRWRISERSASRPSLAQKLQAGLRSSLRRSRQRLRTSRPSCARRLSADPSRLLRTSRGETRAKTPSTHPAWPRQRTTTRAPTGTRLNRSIASMLRMRMQPDDTARPMFSGSLVPWMRYSVSRPS